MIDQNQKYWGSLEELHQSPEYLDGKGREFDAPPHKQPVTDMHRRDFLKVMGASMLMVTASACRRPVEKIIPYVNKPEESTPGIATWYASTCGGCNAHCGVLVKTREGRPIKLEGNPDHPLSRGGLCSRGQASVLDLYDPDRLKGPVGRGEVTSPVQAVTSPVQAVTSPVQAVTPPVQANGGSWEQVDLEIIAALQKAKGVYLLTGSIDSPATNQVIKEFLSYYNSPETNHITYDSLVPEEVARANQLCYGGEKLIPRYLFESANFILSFGADFLGAWVSPVEFAKNFSLNRRVDQGKMSRFVCVEAGLSLTGTNADKHYAVAPGEELLIALAIAHELIIKQKRSHYASDVQITGALKPYSPDSVKDIGVDIEKLAKELWQNRTKSLVLPGALKAKNGMALQVVINLINSVLGNDGYTIDWGDAAFTPVNSSISGVESLIKEMNAGKVGALLIDNSNPVFKLPSSLKFQEALKKVPLVVSFADRLDETANFAHYTCPDSHYLESWNDAHPQKNLYSLVQPTIAPLYSTRQFQESLMKWANKGNQSWHDYLKTYWEQNIFLMQSSATVFENFWNEVLEKGAFEMGMVNRGTRIFTEKDAVSRPFNTDALKIIPRNVYPRASQYGLALYASMNLGDGTSANNSWLQELPDPLSKITWDNYLSIAPQTATELNLQHGDVVQLKGEGIDVEAPVTLQPLLHSQTLMLAVGYGRTHVGQIGNGVGIATQHLQKINNGNIEWTGQKVSQIIKTGKRAVLASTQTHHSIEGRSHVRDTTLAEFKKNPTAGNEEKAHLITMWPEHKYTGNRWGMAIDMNVCIGCSACMVGCQSENNIPTVGKEQVNLARDMHWLRIDRYYKGDENNPEVAYQPMLCQHCENAPCETVCPTLATVHNDEGLNTMIYNRCVGTRYCSNNCPYKVRRFNYFGYEEGLKEPVSLVLNPDVTVRSQGVMEKCTFCTQRIREGKDKAKEEGRSVGDDDIKTACQQSCPTDAIVFGNLNDPESKVSKLVKNPRGYHVLEDLNVKPQVTYLTKVRNGDS